ncbi:hypothetical protein EV361DRAFT_943690, partial [Lentinula raphanica]
TSQLARQSPAVLADKLTESLRATGDVDYVLPAEPMDVDQAARVNDTNMDVDVDAGPAIRPPIAPAAGHNSQFTQSLLLFSQTQSGTRYTPHLTRFYASLLPGQLMALVKETLGSLELCIGNMALRITRVMAHMLSHPVGHTNFESGAKMHERSSPKDRDGGV